MSDAGHSSSDAADRSRGEAVAAVVTSEQLLRGGRELRIVHNGQEYRLQLTRQGKLILTK